MKLYDRKEERTGVQEASPYAPQFDVQCDFVMVYGMKNLKERVAQWKKRGYVIHLMTGVSWGGYQDYLYGKFDGSDHHDEAQKNRAGEEIAHGVDVPYMVPSVSFSQYLVANLKKAVDYGVEAIHLEEPEFWVAGGYSDAFKREWQLYYKEPWQDPASSVDAQYKASALKQYLYTRTLDRLCSELKEYALKKYGRYLRFYVPTHSLINYSQWSIISPESALIDLPSIDGYIAQIWTGTSRVKNFYRGVQKERTFETAFMEYGIMQELVAGTGRDMWFLHDPIEDDPKHTWQDYRENYYRTVVASLFHPGISNYEVCPWPHRVYTGTYPKADGSGKEGMPEEYRTNLTTVMHTLRDMKDQTEIKWETDTREVGVLLSDSAMFQRIYPDEYPQSAENEIAAYWPFFGIALPILKRGVCVRPVQLDNVRRYVGYLDRYQTLVLSYDFMKPTSPDINTALVGWVQNGGKLIYVGDGSDPFDSIQSWWNREGLDYNGPAEQLFEAMGLSRVPQQGCYAVGKGTVCYYPKTPRTIAANAEVSDDYAAAIGDWIGGYPKDSELVLRRGNYVVAAGMDEFKQDRMPYTVKGLYIDLFDHQLSVVRDPQLYPGEVHLWYDAAKIDRSQPAEVLAVSGRMEKLEISQRTLLVKIKGPADMVGCMRIYTARQPKEILVTVKGKTEPSSHIYDIASRTSYFNYPSCPEGVTVKVRF